MCECAEDAGIDFGLKDLMILIVWIEKWGSIEKKQKKVLECVLDVLKAYKMILRIWKMKIYLNTWGPYQSGLGYRLCIGYYAGYRIDEFKDMLDDVIDKEDRLDDMEDVND